MASCRVVAGKPVVLFFEVHCMSIIHDGRYAFVFCNILRFMNVVLKKQTFCVRSYYSVTVGCTSQRVGRLFSSGRVLCGYAIVQERPQ